MKVSLVSYSSPTQELAKSNVDNIQELVAYCARVSNPSNQFNKETSDKLIHYLVRHKHWSPLEMASACLEIETTRDIARQILRHRSFSFQEFSQRYADPVKELEMVTRAARFQDPTNRQNSLPFDLSDPDDAAINNQWYKRQYELIAKVKEVYTWAIDNGIAKEQARAVLPEGLTMSRMYVNGTLRSWIHYIELRSANGTQLEHMMIAKQVGAVIAAIFPIAKDFVE